MPTISTSIVIGEEPKTKKIIRQVVGAIIIDSTNNKVLMVSSHKDENVFQLPRSICEDQETPEQALVRMLYDEAGVKVTHITQKLGTYTEANKKGKIIGHHWIYEIKNPKLLECWPTSDRKRVWCTLNEAIAACHDRHIHRFALYNCSLS